MLNKLKSTGRSIAKRRGALHGPALAGAWFFIVFSLASLAWVTVAKLGDPFSVVSLYQAEISGRELHAFALSYAGVVGLFQVLAQLALVSAAVIWTLSAKPARRRIGHLVLLIWAGIWTLNLLVLAGIQPRLDSVCQVPLMMTLLGCTVYRAARGGKAVASTPAEELAPEELPEEPHSLTSGEVAAGPAVTEITGQVASADVAKSSKLRRLGRGFKAAGRCCKPAAVGVRRVAKRTRPFIARTARHAQPVVSAAGRRASGLLGRLTHYLRDKAIIPNAGKSTAA